MQGLPEPAAEDAPDVGQYFAAEPTTASAPSTVDLDLPDGSCKLTTDRGVFSGSRVDAGTRLLLLDGASPTERQHTLVDLGCGYGPIAVTLARRAPWAEVIAVDVNRRARDLCEANARNLGLGNVSVKHPDEIESTQLIDGIWSNPPIRVGKAALHAMLDTWLARLSDDGRAHLVVAKNLGSDSLARRLVERGWVVTRRASRAGYRLLDIERAGAGR